MAVHNMESGHCWIFCTYDCWRKTSFS